MKHEQTAKHPFSMRILAILMMLSMLIGMLPISAYAAPPLNTATLVRLDGVWYDLPNKLTFSYADGSPGYILGYPDTTEVCTLHRFGDDWAFCIQPNMTVTHNSTQDGVIGEDDATWQTKLTENQRSAITLALMFGYPTESYPGCEEKWVAGSALDVSGSSGEAQCVTATQFIIWEIVAGLRDSTWPYQCNDSALVDSVEPKWCKSTEYPNYSAFYNAYDQISKKMAQYGVIPSFTTSNKPDAERYNISLDYNSSSGKYEGTVTDTNNVLANYDFQSTNGITYTVSGDNLSVSVDNFSAIEDEPIECKSTSFMDASKAVPIIYDLDHSDAENDQATVALYQKSVDPVKAYFTFEVSTGGIEIQKSSDDGQIANISFTVSNGTDITRTVTTNSSGTASLTDLPPGDYTVVETVPVGYSAEASSKTVTVTSGNIAHVDFTNHALSKLNIVKTATDGKVDGVAFTIKNTTTNQTTSVSTDQFGKATVPNLIAGTYTVTESVPTGYSCDNTTQTVDIPWNSTKSVSFNNTPNKVPLTIVKHSDDGIVSGIDFSIEGKNVNNEQISITVTTGTDGTITQDLYPGTYTVTEAASMKNNYTVEDPKTITLDYGEAAHSVSFNNAVLASPVTIVKTSENNVVEGFTFTFVGTDVTGAKINTSGTTDANGKINVELKPGDYTVAETKKDGYISNDARSVTINYGGESVSVPFYNKMERGNLVVTKTSEDDDVEGKTFHLYGTSLLGIDVDLYADTDANGKAYFNDVLISNSAGYTIEEVDVPEKYISPAAQNVSITAGATTTAAFYNELKRGSVTVAKTAEDGIVEAMTFHLYGMSLANIPVDEYVTTDSNGIAKFDGVLISGATAYTLDEVNTPIRYVVPDSQSIVVNYNTNTEAYAENQLKKWTLDLTKVDSEKTAAQGDASLEGAVYGLYIDGILTDTYTTDENGQFSTMEYVCANETGDISYSMVELVPSTGYLRNDEIVNLNTAAALYTKEQNVLAKTVTEDVIKSNLRIIKHHDNGVTQVETPEEGAKFQIYLESAGSFNEADDSVRDTITCNADGIAISKIMPYGKYVVHQVSGAPGAEKIDDFTVDFIDDGKQYSMIINNSVVNGYIKILKTDAETGSTIPLANTAFQIYDMSGDLVKMLTTYPQVVVHDTFYTDESGTLITPEKLYYGTYALVEISAPDGYVLSTDPSYFTVNDDTVYSENGIKIVDAEFANMPQKGTITLSKTGEVFSSVEEKNGFYVPKFENAGLEGAQFDVYASENIYTNDGTLRYSENELVDTIITDASGTATSKELYLGKYHLIESQAPNGYVLDNTTVDATLTYAGQNVAITSTSATATNVRQGLKVTLEKAMEARLQQGDKGELLDVRYGMFAAEDIIAPDGTLIPADGLIDEIGVDENGIGVFVTDVPFGKYYVKETATSSKYILEETEYPFEFSYMGQYTPVVEVYIADGEILVNYVASGWVKIQKVDSDDHSKTLSQAVFAIYEDLDADGAYTNEETDPFFGYLLGINGGRYMLEVPVGNWIIKELKAPQGYILDDQYYPVTIQNKKDEVIENVAGVGFENEQIVVTITKKDALTDEPVSGATYKVTDMGGQVVYTGTTDRNGEIEIRKLTPGIYDLEEVVAPTGYTLDTETHSFGVNVFGETSGDTTVYDIPTYITITKRDITSGAPVPGAEITIYDSRGEEVFKDVTDEDGTVTAAYLAPGTYTFRETVNPDTYECNTETFTFTVSQDGVVTGDNEIFDKPSEVTITKYDITSSEPVEGAVITIYNEDDSIFYTGVTDSEGAIHVSYIPRGNYKFREVITADGYVLNDEVYAFTVKADGTISGDQILTDVPTSFTVTKTDEKTGNPVKGAVIGLFDSAGTLIDKQTTDIEGNATFKYIKQGQYYYQEITAPAGYVLNDAQYDVNVGTDGKATGDDIIVNDPVVVTIKKTALTTAKPIEGAVITIYDENGQEFYTGTTNADGDIYAAYIPAGKYTFVEKVAPKGYKLNTTTFEFTVSETGKITGDNEISDEPTSVTLKKTDLTTSEPLEGATISIYDSQGDVFYTGVSDENGTIHMDHIPAGTYTFKEISAPEGYGINTEAFTFTIDADGTVSGDTEIADKPTSVTITKTDPENGAGIAGAAISILNQAGNTVYTGRTDAEGKITVTNLPVGTYTFKETEAPEGYQLNEESYTFVIAADGTVSGTTSFVNVPVESSSVLVKLVKYEEDKKTPVEGALVGVYDDQGAELLKEKTDKDGSVTFVAKQAGTYSFKEIEAPAGYILNTETFTFTVAEDGTISGPTSFVNKLTKVVITKTDSDTKKPVKNAKVSVYDSASKEVYAGKTDENGTITVTKLTPGKYTFRETEAPAGYQLNKEIYTFEIAADGSVSGTTEFVNVPMGSTTTTTAPKTGNMNLALALILMMCGIAGVGASMVLFRKKKTVV